MNGRVRKGRTIALATNPTSRADGTRRCAPWPPPIRNRWATVLKLLWTCAREGVNGLRGFLAAAILGGLLLACQHSAPRQVTDIDGNSYRTVVLGTQTWLAENLRVARSPAGAPLATFAPNHDAAAIPDYGLLYDWDAALEACPTGWHLPSDAEWTLLERFLGSNVAPRLRDHGHWPDDAASPADATPFHARPAGYGNEGDFENFFGSRALFWTATRQDSHFVWSRVLLSDQPELRRAPQHPQYGFSVRCVRDNR